MVKAAVVPSNKISPEFRVSNLCSRWYDLAMNIPTVIYQAGSITAETKASVEAVTGPVAWIEYVPQGAVVVPVLGSIYLDQKPDVVKS